MRNRWRTRHTTLGVLMAAFFSVRFTQIAVSPLVPEFIDVFAVSTSLVGAAISGMWLTYSLVQLPGGVFGDRFGERRVIVGTLGATLLASLLIAVSPSFIVVAVCIGFLGIGAGVYYPVSAALLSRRFDDIGRTIGLHEAGSNLGGFLAPMVVAVLLSVAGWRSAFLFAAGLVATAAALVSTLLGSTPPVNAGASLRELVDLRTFADFGTRPGLLTTTAVAVAHEFSVQATLSFLPTFLVAYHGLTVGTAGILFSAYFVTVAVAQPVTGAISDRIGRDPAIAAVFLVGVSNFGLIVVTDSFPVVVAATVLIGAAMSGGPSIHSRALDRLDSEERGVGFGLFRSTFMTLGSLSPLIVGTVVDAAGWGVAYGLVAGVLTVGTLVILVRSAQQR
ncbi:MFS transporter [Haloplanus pelagicus]|uniref:MFS transporter n=1 Tax=Haloplanus pelagicus TaxID=2949995 RepID=UPI00203CF359|nr:MFS transporter [Haloplanus sp. HW8-1]